MARTLRSRVPVKMRPPAVNTGLTFGNCEPVSVNPLAASSGTIPNGIFQRIVPVFRSYAVSEVHGGVMTGNPLFANIKPKLLLYSAVMGSTGPSEALAITAGPGESSGRLR